MHYFKMTINSVREIRALKRGISVLRILEQVGASSLEELHLALGLSKTTLSRILVTLQAERIAFQRIADGKWVAGSGIQPADAVSAAHNLLVQAAAPELSKLCNKIIWPSDLSVRSGLKMELVETSRPHTTLLFNKLTVGFQIDFLLSAPGRAYLAFCPQKERNQILGKLKTRPEYKFLVESGELEYILEQVRNQGFGHRDTRWGGRSFELRNSYDDGMDAIAVPILGKQSILGCVNVIWIRSILTQKEAISRYLDDLQNTVEKISNSYASLAAPDYPKSNKTPPALT